MLIDVNGDGVHRYRQPCRQVSELDTESLHLGVAHRPAHGSEFSTAAQKRGNCRFRTSSSDLQIDCRIQTAELRSPTEQQI